MRVSFLLAALGTSICHALSYTGSRILVILDEGTPKADYSQFFDTLADRGFQLTYKTPKDEPKFFHLGERSFDHAIVFPQKLKGLGPSLTAQELAKFLKDGGNILLGGSTSASTSVKDLAKELDIEMGDRDTLVADHFNYDSSSDERHTTVVTSQFANNQHLLREEVRQGSPILYKGVALALGHGQLVSAILSASSTAYSYDIKEEFDAVEEPLVSGLQTYLVAAFQSRKNARVVVTGSVEMFSNAFFTAELGDGRVSGNKEFAVDVTRWLFQEKSVLRAIDLRHSLANETATDDLPKVYRVKNDVHFEISLQLYTDGKWSPYVADDVQLELIMLDPYIRSTIKDVQSRSDRARYSIDFTLPDHYGVFHFKINYKRPGLSYIEERKEVTIRHYRHDEYPRFLTAAYPYYTASATTISAFVVFCAIWFFHMNKQQRGEKKLN